MKSIFLLCEFGVPYNTALMIYNSDITIEDILKNKDILDKVFWENAKKYQVLRAIDKAYLCPDDNSVYELIEFGLSKAIVDTLLHKNIRLKDINKDIQEKYNIGNTTCYKVEKAFQEYLTSKNLKRDLDSSKLFDIVYDIFQNKKFVLNDLIEVLNNHNYKYDETIENELNYLIQAGRIECKEGVYKVPYTVLDLINYGLDSRLLIFLKEKNIELSDIAGDDFATLYHVTPSKYKKILYAFENFIKDTGYCIELTENAMLQIIKKYYKHKTFNLEQLLYKIKDKKFSTEKVEEFLNKLIELNEIIKIDDQFRLPYSTLEEELNKIENHNNHRDMVLKKLSGQTLEQIGIEYGVTRERIRQIVSKELRIIPIVQEDELKDYFMKYNFDVTTFTRMFSKPENVYYYLKEKYEPGDIELSELLNDETITEDQRQIISEKYNLIKLYDEYIIASRNNILISILKNLERQVEFSEFKNIYNNIIIEYSLDLTPIEEKDYRTIDGFLGRSEFVLNTKSRYYRYYNSKNIDEEEKEELKKLLDIEPGVYSTELFINDNPLLMKELDILDEYELHNLLRKVIEPSEDIVYSRMPDIYIKCNDKYQFTESLIQELSPVNVDEFVEFVYQSYGHKMTSFKAYLQSNFAHYINDNTLSSNCEKFNDEQYEFMKNYLKEDIYSTTTIKQLLTDEFDVKNFKLLNNFNFGLLGYKVRGNYIMRSSINNVENYMRNMICSLDFYEASPEIKKIGSTYTSYLYKLIYDKKLFKYDENKYITIKKLESMGISEFDIDDFINKISDIIPENEYFNLFVLNTDFESKLFDLNLPDCFYETIIMILPNVKTFRVKNNTIFIKTSETATREKFINSFIVKDKTYINEIKMQIKNNFNIELEGYYIKEFINKNKYYLHNSTDCVYLNKKVYENEVKQWDILQYID